MVYREHASRLDARESDDPEQSLVAYDASGRRGANGPDGAHGSSGGHSGADGSNGGHAAPAQRGQDGGVVHLELSSGPVGMAHVRGRRTHADGHGRDIDDDLAYGDHGYIDLAVRGGHGGDGGDGGAGGHGAGGSRGSDATRYSSGSSGGAGGDGGDGGNATSGADGGHGGRVTVELDDADTHLLMLVRYHTQPGKGGPAGDNGRGGSGGSGGAGGSSYSWTESESYTDSQGNRQTRTTHHSNPGGSNGPSGSSGYSGRATVFNGRDGNKGGFEIVVDEGGKRSKYRWRYDLRLRSFEHTSENMDGVYEPQERIRVRRVTVQNVGGMATPSQHDIELSLQRHGWVMPLDEKLVLPRSLRAGESHRFEAETLHFDIGDYRPQRPDAPLAFPDDIVHDAHLPSVQRSFRRFREVIDPQQGRFLIRFPAEASELEGLRALPPGQATRLRWTISNSSKVAFGREAENGRRLRFRLYTNESELGDEHAVFLDADGRRVSMKDGYQVEIDRIKPGETMSFEGTIALRDSAPYYRSLNLWLALELGFIDDPASVRPVLYRDINTRVARRYVYDPQADLLLVVNHRTEREELDAWHAMAAEMGFTLSVWDLSLENGIDFEGRVSGSSLIAQWSGKTVAILNNTVRTPKGERVAAELVDKAQLQAALAGGVSVAFVGEPVDLRPLLIPTIGEAAEREAPQQPDELLDALVARSPDELGQVHEHAEVIRRRWFRRIPDGSSAADEAVELARELSERYPDKRFIAVYGGEPELLDDGWLLAKWRTGSVELRSTLPAASGSLVSARSEADVLHTPGFVLDDDTLMTVLVTRSFEEKLTRLDKLIGGARIAIDGPAGTSESGRTRERLITLVTEALLVDLANEQSTILETRWRSGLSRAEMLDSMPRLRRLGEFRLSSEELQAPESVGGKAIIGMAARLRSLAHTRWRFWEWLPPFFMLRRAPWLTLHTRRVTADLLEAVFGSDGDYLNVAKGALDSEIDRLRQEYRESRRGLGIERATSAHEEDYFERMLKAHIERAGIATDAEVLNTFAQRVLAADEHAAIAMGDKKRSKRRRQTMKASANAEAQLLRSETTADLIA